MWSNLIKLTTPIKREKGKEISIEPLILLELNWNQLLQLLSSTTTATTLNQLVQLLNQLLSILTTESTTSNYNSTSPGKLGPCLEFLLKNNVLATLVKFVIKDEPIGIRIEVINWFGKLINEMDQMFLMNGSVSGPLIKLLKSSVEAEGGLARSEEEIVVNVICSICQRIKIFPELLVIFFRERSIHPQHLNDLERPSSPTPSTSTIESSTSTSYTQSSASYNPNSNKHRVKKEHEFLLFTYLLRFVHREGKVGDYSRNGLLSLVELACSSTFSPSTTYTSTMIRTPSPSTILPPTLTSSSNSNSIVNQELRLSLLEYILDSNFSSVVSAGLGALYGLLPTKLIVRSPASSSPSKVPGTGNDSVEISSPRGMVLGGMGSLGELELTESELEELERRREEEEERLKDLGVGSTGTREFKEGLGGFLDLIEFLQDVLRFISISTDVLSNSLIQELELEDEEEVEDPEESQSTLDLSRQHLLLISALSTSLLSSLQSLFLQNVLYPSILECSTEDGSAVAVLSYLNSLLEVLEEGNDLEGVLLGYLMGAEKDEEQELVDRKSAISRLRLLPSSSRFNNKLFKSNLNPKSNNLILIENTSNTLNSKYYTSLGRFTLKDLLIANLSPSTSSTTSSSTSLTSANTTNTTTSSNIAALRLLQTLLVKHDRWSIELLDIVAKEGATGFPRPFGLVSSEEVAGKEEIEEEAEEEFIYREATDEEEEEVFIYPFTSTSNISIPTSTAPVNNRDDENEESNSPTTPRPRNSILNSNNIPSTPPFNKPNSIALPSPLSNTPAIVDPLDSIVNLIRIIDPSYSSTSEIGIRGEVSLSSGFENYLLDAEDVLARDLGFIRGLDNVTSNLESSTTSQIKSRNLLNTISTNSTLSSIRSTTIQPHTLQITSPLLSLLLESLSSFFTNSADLNLVLTGVLTKLLVCPFRSLESWFLPDLKEGENGIKFEGGRLKTLAELIMERNGNRTESSGEREEGEGDEENLNSRIQLRLTPRVATPSKSSSQNHFQSNFHLKLKRQERNSLLSILTALTSSISHYRMIIPKFEFYLSERRLGLMFVENLTDALDLDLDLGTSGSGSLSPNTIGNAGELSTPVKPKPISKGFGAFLSPRSSNSSTSIGSSSSNNIIINNNIPQSPPPHYSEENVNSNSNLGLGFNFGFNTPPPKVPSKSPSISNSASNVKGIGPASPFAAHYKETGSISVKPLIVNTSIGSSSLRNGLASSITGTEEEDGGEEVEGDEAHVPDSPTKRLSSLPPLPPPLSPSVLSEDESVFSNTTSISSTSEEDGSGNTNKDQSNNQKKNKNNNKKEIQPVSLSMILDNCLVLEEFLKELLAVSLVRRKLGIDEDLSSLVK